MVALLAVAVVRPMSHTRQESVVLSDRTPQSALEQVAPPLLDVDPSDQELQAAADALLAAVNPALPDNEYFNGYARAKVGWLRQEQAAGRLTIAFLLDTTGIALPPDVLMAATHLDGRPTIVIPKARFASFLREGGRFAPPFTQQQKNDFLIGLTHEVIHLEGAPTKVSRSDERIREEWRAWREVTIQLVRPFRALGQPLNRRFTQVDDAIRRCGDRLPCETFTTLVRLAR